MPKCAMGSCWLGVAGLALASAVWGAGSVARGEAVDPRVASGDALLADQMMDDARFAARELMGRQEDTTAQALVLLRQARVLDPKNTAILRLLAEAAEVSGDAALQRDALKSLIASDPGDLVAQVNFLQTLAESQQTADGQLKIYDASLAQVSLDAQVRSEVAVRAARLLLQRGQRAEAAEHLKKAVSLNDANAAAWKELAGLMDDATPADRLATMFQSLEANPYQPEVLVEAGHLLATANLHASAARLLLTGAQQSQIDGAPLSMDLWSQIAIELAAGDRQLDLHGVLEGMLKNDQVTLPVLMLAYTTRSPNGVPPGPANDELLGRIRKIYDAGIRSNPGNLSLLRDAVWFELFYGPAVTDATDKRLKDFEEAVGASNPEYQRLRGWRLLRDKQYKAATELLTPLAATDPWAALGLVRAAVATGDSAGAGDRLATLYAAHPVGMLAVHVINAAKALNVPLKATPLSMSMQGVLERLSDTALRAHTAPRDLVLITAAPTKKSYPFGEPAFLDVTCLNATDHALSVGPEGGVRSGIGVAAILSGFQDQALGLYAVDQTPRIFRLERHASLNLRLPLDQGLVRIASYREPLRLNTFALTVITGPRVAGSRVGVGLGGQQVSGGTFDRTGFLEHVDDPQALVSQLPAMSPYEQMVNAVGLYAISRQIGGFGTQALGKSKATPEEIRQAITAALIEILAKGSATTQAWLVRQAPISSLPGALNDALEQKSSSPIALVRTEAFWRMSMAGRLATTVEGRKPVADKLAGFLAKETDPEVKTLLTGLVGELRTVPAVAETGPGTGPGTGPATGPATAPSMAP